MEQPNDNLTSDDRADPFAWASEVLELDTQVADGVRGDGQRRAVAAFFERLKSNDFFVGSDKPQAVEMVLGKSVVEVRGFQKYRDQEVCLQIDEVVAWFASQLGVMEDADLLGALKQRLTELDLRGCSVEVHDYAETIWCSGQAVDRRVSRHGLAAKKIIQALFHISTVRQSQRCRVRKQWLEELKGMFSVSDLTAARYSVRRTAQVPQERFHQPFLFMLTRECGELEQRRLPPPVDSGRSASVHQTLYEENSIESGGSKVAVGFAFFLGLVVVCVMAAVSNSLDFNAEDQANKASGKEVVNAVVPSEKRSQDLAISSSPNQVVDKQNDGSGGGQ